MARKTGGNRFSAPAQKYSGQIKVGAGPVPFQRWIRPLTRADKDNPDGSNALVDLRPERPSHAKGTIPGTPSGGAYNRQSGRGS